MKIPFQGRYQLQPRELIRKAGYAEFRDPRTRQISYVRRLSGSAYYPRFHCYLELKDGGFQVNLHLDQKQASYKGTNMHGGEYDGPVVEQEGARIRETIQHYAQ